MSGVGGRSLALELHHRPARDDAKLADRRQLGRQLVGHAFGEVVLVGIARVVVERKHGNRSDDTGGGRGPRAGEVGREIVQTSRPRPPRPPPRRSRARPTPAVSTERAAGPPVLPRSGRTPSPVSPGRRAARRPRRSDPRDPWPADVAAAPSGPAECRRPRSGGSRSTAKNMFRPPTVRETDDARRSSRPGSRRTKTGRSARRVAGLSPARATCSPACRRRLPGAVNWGAASMVAASASTGPESRMARPKSMTFTWPCSVSMMLAGLRSRCMIPR